MLCSPRCVWWLASVHGCSAGLCAQAAAILKGPRNRAQERPCAHEARQNIASASAHGDARMEKLDIEMLDVE